MRLIQFQFVYENIQEINSSNLYMRIYNLQEINSELILVSELIFKLVYENIQFTRD